MCILYGQKEITSTAFNMSKADAVRQIEKILIKVIDTVKTVVIAGPTATGKSDIAVQLCKKYNGYIINADSRQIYKEISIGTAQPKPDKIIRNTSNKILNMWMIDDIPHFLYGFTSLSEQYSIYEYIRHVKKVRDYMEQKYPEKLAFLVGGTGLYIDSIVYNYNIDTTDHTHSCTFSREQLASKSKDELQKIAKGINPESYKKLNNSDLNNPHRLTRFIERNGEFFRKADLTDCAYFVINPDFSTIEDNISRRTKIMLQSGLVEENIKLRTKSTAFIPKIIGYYEFNKYKQLDDLSPQDINQIEKDIILHTKQYAKRQLTWFRKNSDCSIIA